MDNLNEIFNDLAIKILIYNGINKDEYLYEGWICYASLKDTNIRFKIKTKEIAPILNSTRKDGVAFVFKYLIGQGEFDYYIKELDLIQYTNEFLIYCGDLKEFYLTTKLYLNQQKEFSCI